MNTKAFFRSAALSLAALTALPAQEAVTDPVGFVNVTVPAQSDGVIGAPLQRSAEFLGRIKSISGSTVTVVGAPNWTTDAFKFVAGSQTKTYYLRIDSGSKEGMWLTITGNAQNQITVALAGEDFSGVKSEDVDGFEGGDLVSIVPYWTPASLIGTVPNGCQLYFYRPTSGGINVAPTRILTFNATTGNWIVGFNTNANHDIINPGEGLVFRNPSTSPISLSFTGSVLMVKHRSLIKTLVSNTARDQRIVYQGPIPEKIGSMLSGFANGDQLLFYNNAATGYNKGPSAVLTWRASDANWIQGFGTIVSNTFEVAPGTSFTYRKAATSNPQAFVWQDLPSYLTP